MGRFTKKKETDGVEATYPKLNLKQLQEISELYVRYGSINRILREWGAVKLDTEGNIVAICDYTEHYNQSEYNKEQYENLEPLKGVKYLGQGYVTMTPYNWCSEWLATWAQWITKEAERGDIQALSFSPNKKFIKENFSFPQVNLQKTC